MRTIADNRKPIKAYQWNLLTMDYSGEISCIPDKLDASRWQVPGNATTQEPPAERKGYVRKWDSDKDKWVQSKVKK
jgi:hypothetical protein